MSISEEYAKEHRNDPAVLCCRAEEGTVIDSHNLEDPEIFPDLEDSGLLNTSGALTIGQVLGATLLKTSDSLTALTPSLLKNYGKEEASTQESDEPAADEDAADETGAAEAGTVSAVPAGGTIVIDIGEGKDIHLEIPAGAGGSAAAQAVQAVKAASGATEKAQAEGQEAAEGGKLVRELTRKQFPVKKVVLGDETKYEDGVLTVRKSLEEDAVKVSPIVKKVEIDLITPDKQDVYTHSMMDICPIAVKKEGKLGTGLTYEFTGAVVMLTGVEESGKECSDAASSDGIFSEKCIFGRPGAPDKDDYVIRMHVVIEDGYQMERPGPMAAHRAADVLTQEIREVLKGLDESKAENTLVMDEIRHPGKPKVLYVKEIMGQGAMHDNLILPEEPCGYLGARPNVDLGNMPVFLRTNEVRDGGIHALTCITPDTKETTRLYWREPILKLLAEDEEIDFVGVLFVGSPQANTEKFYVSERVGATVEAMDVDGCIVSTEGFGNNHVDFASHIEQIGSLDIPVVGTSFCGIQGALVVGNKYMDAMVDMCVSADGWETDNLCENQLTPEVAFRCVAMLKDKMMGKKIDKAARKFNPDDIEHNQEEVARVYGN